MRRLLASLSTAALLASPISAFATLTDSSAVLSAIQTMDDPVSFELVLHGHGEGTYVSVWLSGSEEGDMTDPLAKAKLKATIDVVQGDSSMRAKVQMSMFDGMEYMRVDSIEGEETLLEGLSLQGIVGKWIREPMGDTPSMDMMVGESSAMLQILSPMLFDLKHNRFPGGHAYVLTSNMMPGDMEFTPVDMKITVNTDEGDNANYAYLTMKVADPASDAWLDLSAKIQTIGGHVNVEVPSVSMTMEEFEAQISMMNFPGLMGLEAFSMPMMDSDMMEDEWMDSDSDMEESGDSEWSDEWETPTDEDWDSDWTDIWEEPSDMEVPSWIDGCTTQPGTPERVMEIRKGTCNPEGIGRGQVLRSR